MAMRHQARSTAQPAAARGRARHLLARRVPGAAPAGKIYHGCNASFLIAGDTASMLVETGHPKDFPITEAQLNKLLPGRPPLKYLFVTHQETPHCGGLGACLTRFPDAILVGDVSDYHLASRSTNTACG